ncbi:MAG: TrkA C-terminal domain-containing protein [Phycisphaerales bacterium]
MTFFALFIIAIVSLLIVRVGATAFRMTGLSEDVSLFQSLSCFFGVGFTTREAELIVTHPVRRKIASYLIVIGNIGILTALSAMVVTFMQSEPDWLEKILGVENGLLPFVIRVLIIIVGVLLIVMLFRFKIISLALESVIQKSLEKSGVVRPTDFETLLHTGHGYAVTEYLLEKEHPLIGCSLGDAGLGHRGVLVLGIDRGDGEYIGAPNRRTTLEEKDLLTVYGLESAIESELTPEANHAAARGGDGKEGV